MFEKPVFELRTTPAAKLQRQQAYISCPRLQKRSLSTLFPSRFFFDLISRLIFSTASSSALSWAIQSFCLAWAGARATFRMACRLLLVSQVGYPEIPHELQQQLEDHLYSNSESRLRDSRDQLGALGGFFNALQEMLQCSVGVIGIYPLINELPQ